VIERLAQPQPGCRISHVAQNFARGVSRSLQLTIRQKLHSTFSA
jgi:hypothetical protein